MCKYQNVPTGCRERLEFIQREAEALANEFGMGSREFVAKELERLPPPVSRAVVALMCEVIPPEKLSAYLKEIA
jgi:hypothetical protein